MKEINLNNKIILLEALEYIDRDLITETVENLKAPKMRGIPERDKSTTRKSIKYAITLAACMLLLGAVIPVVSYLIRILPGGPGGNPGTDTTTETAEAIVELTSPEETTQNTTPVETAENTTAEETTAAPALPDNMKYDEGYAIVSYNTFKIIVAENGEKLLHDARVAILSHIDGFNAIYVDVLDTEGNVKLHKTWKGRCHLFLIGDRGLLLYRVHVDTEKKATLQLNYYAIADFKYTASGETPTGSTQFIVRDIDHDDFVTASFASAADISMASSKIKRLLGYVDFAISDYKTECYTIADSYSDADKLITYSPEDKVLPEVLDNVGYKKYELDYILALFGIN